MIQLIRTLALALTAATVVTSCNQGPTLQTYYVDNEMRPGFASFDVPTSFINVEAIEMTDAQREAYKSVKKLNVLTYMEEDTSAENYILELEKVKTILEKPEYEELIRGGNSTDGKFMIKFLGDVEQIDELIIFANANDRGFVIARILGKDMNAANLMSLTSVLQKADFETDQLKGLTDFFK